jgi:hypothetical protein
MRMDTWQVRVIAMSALTALFAVAAVNLFVPIVMVSVMGLVDRLLMHLWYGVVPQILPPLVARFLADSSAVEETAA